MKKSRRTYNGLHLNKKSNTQDVVEQSLPIYKCIKTFCKLSMLLIIKSKNMEEYSNRKSSIDPKMNERVITAKF